MKFLIATLPILIGLSGCENNQASETDTQSETDTTIEAKLSVNETEIIDGESVLFNLDESKYADLSSWSIDFDNDGEFEIIDNTDFSEFEYQYSAPGIYTASVIIKDTNNSTDSDQVTITVLPDSHFTLSSANDEYSLGNTIIFSAENTEYQNTTYQWYSSSDINSQTQDLIPLMETNPNGVISYNQLGDQKITLKITTNEISSETSLVINIIESLYPKPIISDEINSIIIDEVVYFDASDSLPGKNTSITDQLWTIKEAESKEVIYTDSNAFFLYPFETTGDYIVELQLTNNDNLSSVTSKEVTVFDDILEFNNAALEPATFLIDENSITSAEGYADGISDIYELPYVDVEGVHIIDCEISGTLTDEYTVISDESTRHLITFNQCEEGEGIYNGVFSGQIALNTYQNINTGVILSTFTGDYTKTIHTGAAIHFSNHRLIAKIIDSNFGLFLSTNAETDSLGLVRYFYEVPYSNPDGLFTLEGIDQTFYKYNAGEDAFYLNGELTQIQIQI